MKKLACFFKILKGSEALGSHSLPLGFYAQEQSKWVREKVLGFQLVAPNTKCLCGAGTMQSSSLGSPREIKTP